MLWVAQAHLAMSHATTLVAGTQIPAANERQKQQAFYYPLQKFTNVLWKGTIAEFQKEISLQTIFFQELC